MSTNRNRSRLNKSENGRNYHIKWIHELYPRYWDDGLFLYPTYRQGFKNSRKLIMSYQVRMYRTWKHNRRTQWRTNK